MEKSKNFILIILLISIIIMLTGCSKENLNIDNKIDAELDFSENRVLNFLKVIESGSYLKDGDVEWDKLKKETDIFVGCFPVIEADFSYMKIQDSKLNYIKSNLQGISQNIESKNLDGIINNYSELYMNLLDVKPTNNRQLKKEAMLIYNYALKEDNGNIQNSFYKIKSKFDEYKNNADFIKINLYSISKIENYINGIEELNRNNNYKEIRKTTLKLIEIM